MRNWRTTISGILALLGMGVVIYQNPSKASNPEVIAGIITGVGLIAAKDANVSGPPVVKP